MNLKKQNLKRTNSSRGNRIEDYQQSKDRSQVFFLQPKTENELIFTQLIKNYSETPVGNTSWTNNQRLGQNDNKKAPTNNKHSILVFGDENQKRIAQLLDKKIFSVWIFAIKDKLEQQQTQKIRNLYNQIVKQEKYKDQIVPLCSNVNQIKQFLEIPNARFKVVTDLKSLQEVLDLGKAQKKIVEYHIFGQNYDQLRKKAAQKKADNKDYSQKIKGIYINLQKIINAAQNDIDTDFSLYRNQKHKIVQKHTARIFPAFIKLSGYSKSEATLYRCNLYGAAKLQESQRKKYLKYFVKLAREKYRQEQNNIRQYEQLEHVSTFSKESRTQIQNNAAKILNFYSKDSFYHKLLNSMLRCAKFPSQFKPCFLPFYQTYHAIKIFYTKQMLNDQNYQTKNLGNKYKYQIKARQRPLYRGANLRKRQFNSLKPGFYIEMYGFMSTSSDLKIALNFLNKQNSYLFVIHIPNLQISKSDQKYDHGFVDSENISFSEFFSQKEVLFNALNIYKIAQIKEQEHLVDKQYRTVTQIHLIYGAIFQLSHQNPVKITNFEREVLSNYRYCSYLQMKIEDIGDVYMTANEPQKAKQQYNKRIKKEPNNPLNYLKLANTHNSQGQLKQANKNVEIFQKLCLQKQGKEIIERHKQTYSFNNQRTKILAADQNYLANEEKIIKQLDIHSEESQEATDLLQKLAKIKLKKGQIQQALKIMQILQKSIQKTKRNFIYKKVGAAKDYVVDILFKPISGQSYESIRKKYDQNVLQIKEKQNQINENYWKINYSHALVIEQIQKILKFIQNNKQYSEYVQKGRALINQMKILQSQDPNQKASLQFLEATIQGYNNLLRVQNMIYEAIELVQREDPNNMEIVKYAKHLAKLQQEQLKIGCLRQPPPNQIQELKATMTAKQIEEYKKKWKQRMDPFNLAERCRNNLNKAIDILRYNKQAQNSPQMLQLRNQLSDLQLNRNCFKQCAINIQKVKDSLYGQAHSQLSRAHCIMAKINFSRGQYKSAFIQLDTAQRVLKRVFFKKVDTPQKKQKCQKAFKKNQIYIEILILRSKIFRQQEKHNQCDKTIKNVKNILKQMLKIDLNNDMPMHSFKAVVLQEQAIINYFKAFGQAEISKQTFYIKQFINKFQEAIMVRKQQKGSHCIDTVTSLFTFAKYLIIASEFDKAEIIMRDVEQMLSFFLDNQSIQWQINYLYAISQQLKVEQELQNQYFNTKISKDKYFQISESYQNALKKLKCYDRSHISVLNVMTRYAKSLLPLGKLDKADIQLNSLQNYLNKQLIDSQKRLSQAYKQYKKYEQSGRIIQDNEDQQFKTKEANLGESTELKLKLRSDDYKITLLSIVHQDKIECLKQLKIQFEQKYQGRSLDDLKKIRGSFKKKYNIP